MALVSFMLIADLHMTGFELKDGLVCPRLPAHAWWAVDRRYDIMGYLLPIALQQAQTDFKPGFVMFGGDLVDDGFGKYGLGDLTMVRDLARKHCKGKACFLYGNHDGPQAQFEELFGPLNYTFDQGNLRFIVLNTGTMDWEKEEASSRAAIAHLQESLRTAEGRKVVVIAHQWLYPTDVEGYSMAHADEALAALEAYPGTVAVLNGHYHTGKYQEKNGIHYLTAKAFCERPFAYYEYQITADELVCTEYTLKPSQQKFIPGQEQRLKLRR